MARIPDMDRFRQLVAGSVFASGAMFLLACAVVIEPYGSVRRDAFTPSRGWCASDTATAPQDRALRKQLLETAEPVTASAITYGF